MKKASVDQQIHCLTPTYQIVKNKLDQLPCQPLQFNCLSNIRKTACVEQKRNPKQKYGFGMGYAKKVLDYAIWTDKVDEFINYLERFIKTIKSDLDKQQENDGNVKNLIVEDPIHVQHKGQQPNCYKLGSEVPLKKKAPVYQDNTVDQT
ncbi:39370_t:CDS:2, partial [Gigaspora margarita]